MRKSILAVLSDGFEETEAVAVIDIMRRIGNRVVIASLQEGDVRTGAHGMRLAADCGLEAALVEKFDAIFLPGGMPGADLLRQSETVVSTIREYDADGRIVSAICAAPIVLATAGVLGGKRFTMYPGFEQMLGGLVPSGAAAESDGNVVTGRGPGAVFAFSAALADALGQRTELEKVYAGMFVETR